MYTKGDLCSCGFPQSYPIPHEHDRTEREKQIIKHKDEIMSDLYEACKEVVKTYKCSPTSMQLLFWLRCLQALVKAKSTTE